MRVLYVTGLVVLFDQVVKLLVKGFEIPFLNLYVSGMALGTSYPIFGDFLRLTFIENPGMAFGIDLGGKLFLTMRNGPFAGLWGSDLTGGPAQRLAAGQFGMALDVAGRVFAIVPTALDKNGVQKRTVKVIRNGAITDTAT